MQSKFWRKGIVVAIIFLFIGSNIVPSIYGDNLQNNDLGIVKEDKLISEEYSYFDISRGTTYVNITPSSQKVEKGETFTIDVYVAPGEPIIGIEFDLAFNATLLQAESVTEGDLFDGYTSLFNDGDIDNNTGDITGVYGLVLGDTVSDPGDFCIIEFIAQDIAGTSDLDLYDVIVTDENGDPIPGSDLEINDGDVTVEANLPPIISDPDPYDTETDVSIDLSELSVTIEDPEGDSFDWSIETSPDIGNSSGSDDTNNTMTCPVDNLEFDTLYHWFVNATDTGGSGETTSEIYEFTTEINNPPNEPSDPDPYDGETDVDRDHDLSWTGGDQDNDTVYYDIYFEADDPTPDVLVSENQTGTTYNLDTMDPETTYYWQIIAEDEYGAITDGPIWDFTTEENTPPNEPSDPDPYDGETDVDIDHDLSWTGGDEDDDTVYYDVYFEADDPTPDVLISEGQTGTTCDPGTMDLGTTYYWQIIAEDEYGAITDGPIWDFTTAEIPKDPDLHCTGTLSWTGVKPDATVSDIFNIENIGDPGSLLDWEITEKPNWGTWTIAPSSGTGLTPEDGAISIDVIVKAPDESDKGFYGKIRVENSNDDSDYCTIDVSLVTPKSKSFNYFQNYIFNWFFERFPNAFPILRFMLDV